MKPRGILFSTAKTYCSEDISLIENYSDAVKDPKNYVCHHRLETEWNVSRKWLKEHNLYFNRPAKELIFMTRSSHASMHSSRQTISDYQKKIISETHKGKILSEETRKKISDKIRKDVPKEELYQLRYIEKLSPRECAKHFGVGLSLIYHRITEYGFPKNKNNRGKRRTS